MQNLQKALAGLVAFLSVGLASAADKPKSRWPATPVPMPEKVTPPAALPVSVVNEDDWFIIERDEPAIALCSPDGLVTFRYVENAAACPIRYKGSFAGSTGKKEERTYTGKFLIEVSPAKTGRCEIFIVPREVATEDVIERRTVDVKAGDGAQPPPPKDPPTTPPIGKVYFLVVRPDGPASQEFARVMADPAWAEHKAAGRLMKDKTLTESVPLYRPPAGTALPFVVTLSSGDTESKVIAGPVPLPTTSDGIRKLSEGIK